MFYQQVFDNASVDSVIFQLTKRRKVNQKIKVIEILTSDFENDVRTKYKYLENEDLTAPDFKFNFDNDSDSESIIEQIEKDTWCIKDIGRSYFGIQTHDRNTFVSKTKLSETHFPVIDGANVKKYELLESSDFVDFRKENVKNGGNLSVYLIDRIVVRQIGEFPYGSICPPNLFTLNTIYNIFLHSEEVSLKYVLSIINSKVTAYYWNKLFYDNKATFPKITKSSLESIRIPKLTLSAQKPFIDLVDKILADKKAGEDTRALEAEIDRLVYGLYDLTEAEIKVVEGR